MPLSLRVAIDNRCNTDPAVFLPVVRLLRPNSGTVRLNAHAGSYPGRKGKQAEIPVALACWRYASAARIRGKFLSGQSRHFQIAEGRQNQTAGGFTVSTDKRRIMLTEIGHSDCGTIVR